MREAPLVDALRGHRVVRVGDEDDPRAERDRVAVEPVGIAGPVPALVVVQHPLGDRVDAEALEHPEADLRMALEHHPLGIGERARLAQDLLGDGELAEVVQARGEPGQLDQLGVGAQLERDPRGELADALRVAARVRVARVDRLGEARGGAVAGGTVRPCGEALQLGQLDDVRPVEADAVLAALLRPVERRVGEADQLVAADPVRRDRSRFRR